MKSQTPLCHVHECKWSSYADSIRQIRRRVFIDEQHVPEDLEWDDLDPTAIHLALFHQQAPTLLQAYARLLPEGKLTRMAVEKEFRHQGMGTSLVLAAVTKARSMGLKTLKLDAQTYARPFYERLGFVAVGSEFWDAGIEHIHMTLDLSQTRGENR